MASNRISAKELEELKKYYQQIEALTYAAADAEAQRVQAIGQARQELDRLRKEYTELTSDISVSLTAFQRIVQEISNQNIGLNNSVKAYKNLTSIAEKIQYHQKDISKMSAKDIVNLKTKIELEKQRLENAQELLRDDEASLTTKQNQLQQQLAAQIRNNNALRAQGQLTYSEKKARRDIERQLEKNYDQLVKTQQALSENEATINGTNVTYNALVATAEKLNKELGFMGRLAGKLGNIPGLGKSLGGAAESLNQWGKGAFIIAEIIKGFNSLNKAQVEFGRETGKNIAHMDTLNMALISSSDYIKTATLLSKQFGANADAIFTKETLQEATEMVNLMGMASEDAGRLARFTRLSGVDLKASNISVGKQLESFNRTNRTGISLSSVFRDVAKISDDIAMSLGGNPPKIANAVAEARKLGLSLDQVNKIAGSLLQFEDSISAELEAELLTGKQINLEQARLYALNNDIVGLTKEIGTNQDFINSFVGSNRIQQEAIAKSLGLGRDEMAKMIYDQRTINGLSDEQLQKVMGVGSEELKRLSIQESITKSIEKMTEALAGPLEFMAELVGHTGVMYTILGAIGAILTTKIIKGAIDFGKALYTAIPKLVSILTLESGIAAAKITAAEAASLGLATVGIVAGIAAAMGAFDSATDKATSKAQQLKDGIIDPNVVDPNGGIVASKPEGGIIAQFDKQDYIVGTTNKPGTGGNSAPAEFDYDKMATAMAKLKININTTVQIDKKEIGSVVNEVQLTTGVKTQ
jgi:hypothetical protein